MAGRASAGREPSPHRLRLPGVPERHLRLRLLLTLLELLAIAVMVGVIFAPPSSPERSLSYSDFMQMVRADQIAEVVIGERHIRGRLRNDNQAFDTTRIEDPRLLDALEQHHVKVTGEAGTNAWVGLAVWVVPLLLMILFWGLMLRRLVPRQGAMAFERSRAKIYAEDDVKVTFADVAGIDEATAELREIVEFLQHPTRYTDLGGRIPKGVLLLGRRRDILG